MKITKQQLRKLVESAVTPEDASEIVNEMQLALDELWELVKLPDTPEYIRHVELLSKLESLVSRLREISSDASAIDW